jgi:hypothetical protein
MECALPTARRRRCLNEAAARALEVVHLFTPALVLAPTNAVIAVTMTFVAAMARITILIMLMIRPPSGPAITGLAAVATVARHGFLLATLWNGPMPNIPQQSPAMG